MESSCEVEIQDIQSSTFIVKPIGEKNINWMYHINIKMYKNQSYVKDMNMYKMQSVRVSSCPLIFCSLGNLFKRKTILSSVIVFNKSSHIWFGDFLLMGMFGDSCFIRTYDKNQNPFLPKNLQGMR